MADRLVVAMGGGGFSMEPDNLLLDRFVLSLARATRPRVCLVPTASGDADGYVAGFYRSFATLDCQPADLQLFKRNVADLHSFVLDQDVIYVGGGNTANLLAVWRVHELDRVLRRAWEQGVVLCGVKCERRDELLVRAVTHRLLLTLRSSRRCAMGCGCYPAAAARTTTPRPNDDRRFDGWSVTEIWPPAGPLTTGRRCCSPATSSKLSLLRALEPTPTA